MRIPLLSAWLDERAFDRNHRPFLVTRPFPPVLMDNGQWYIPDLHGFYCEKHDCFFHDCPKGRAA